jgi:GDP-4-dehydro-6-deoxy-D-mannose reductase
MRPKRWLVTGISGFVGGFLAEHLLDNGIELIGLSPDGKPTASSPSDLGRRVEILPWDLGRDKSPASEVLGRLCDFRPDAICHLAALSVPADCGANEPNKAAQSVNVEGTRRLVELAGRLQNQIGLAPRTLMVSTSHIYAPVDPGNPTVDEQSPVGPTRGYGISKLAAEQIALDTAKRLGLELIVARPFQHTGPRQSARMMLPGWCKQIAKDSLDPIEIYTRDARIDMTDVRDVVRAYRLLIEQGEPGAIYNVGSGRNLQTGRLLERLCQIAKVDRPIIETRPGAKQDPIAAVDRLRKTTGWTVQISVDQTLTDTLNYWLKTRL